MNDTISLARMRAEHSLVTLTTSLARGAEEEVSAAIDALEPSACAPFLPLIAQLQRGARSVFDASITRYEQFTRDAYSLTAILPPIPLPAEDRAFYHAHAALSYTFTPTPLSTQGLAAALRGETRFAREEAGITITLESLVAHERLGETRDELIMHLEENAGQSLAMRLATHALIHTLSTLELFGDADGWERWRVTLPLTPRVDESAYAGAIRFCALLDDAFRAHALLSVDRVQTVAPGFYRVEKRVESVEDRLGLVSMPIPSGWIALAPGRLRGENGFLVFTGIHQPYAWYARGSDV